MNGDPITLTNKISFVNHHSSTKDNKGLIVLIGYPLIDILSHQYSLYNNKVSRSFVCDQTSFTNLNRDIVRYHSLWIGVGHSSPLGSLSASIFIKDHS